MKVTEAQRRANKKWRTEKMHRIAVDCTLADYETIKRAADAAGVPVGTFSRAAIMDAATKDARPGIVSEPVPESDPLPEPERVPFVDDP